MTHWGYGASEGAPNGVRMDVPADMVDVVNALLQDPEQFYASIAQSATEGIPFIVLGEHTFDPRRIVTIRDLSGVNPRCRVYLEGMIEIDFAMTPQQFVSTIQQRLSDPAGRVDNTNDEKD